MKMNTKFFALLFVIFFVSISLVSASDSDNQTLMINNNDDMGLSVDDSPDYDLSVDESASDNYTAGTGTFTELQKTIWGSTAGDTLVLDKDYELDSDLVRQHIIIDRTLTIDGNGHTLDAKNLKRIFYIEPQATNTVLKNINFVNGYHSQSGSAIFWRADNGVLTDCTFTNNVANENGGAVYWGGNNGTATNNVFKNNKAGVEKLSSYQSAGAIYWEGNDGNVSNNQFSDNFALTNGGAITWKGTGGTLKNNVFTNNLGKESGGAVYWDGSDGIIDNNTFDSNTAELSGGALYYEAKNGVASNNKFIKNKAITNAGAIRWKGDSGTVTDNYFESNTATLTGGAIYWEGTKGQLKNNEFIKSNADVSAGAVMWNGNSATLDNNIYTDNTAKEYGGAVYFKGNSSSLTNSQFKNNKAAKSGAAIYWEGNSGQVTKNTFEDSISSEGSGAAIKWSGSDGVVSENNFKNSQAVSGGAVYWDGANGKLTNNNFTKSTASKAGGAVYWNSNGAEITGNSFDGSTTTSDYGGAIYFNGDSSKINNNIFTNNKASKSGGALYYNGASNTANNNIFRDNTAQSGSGGAVSWNGKQATLTNNTFKGNSAQKGTAVYGEGNNAKVTKNTFLNSKEDDGTLRWEGSAEIKDNIYRNEVRTTKIALNNMTIYYGQNARLVATLTDTDSQPLSGKPVLIIIFHGERSSGETDSKGQVSTELSTMDVGTYTVSAQFAGDNDYDPSSAKATVTVKKAPTTTTLNLTKDLYSGQDIVLTAYVNATEGNVTFYVGPYGESRTRNLVNGAATLRIPSGFIAGEYDVNATYNPGDNYLTSSAKDKFTVHKRETTINISDADIYVGGKGEVVLTLIDCLNQTVADATINVSFLDNTSTLTTDSEGKATLELEGLAAGTYQINALYEGNEDHYLNSTATATITVKSTIESNDLTAEIGDVKYNATFFDTNGKPLAKGEYVSFIVENDNLRAKVENNGVATITIDKGVGDYTITNINTVTGESTTNKLKITKASSTMTMNNVTFYYSGSEKLNIALTDKNSKPLANKNITLTINGKNIELSTDEKGTAFHPVTDDDCKTFGTYEATVKFAGDEDYGASQATSTVTYKTTLISDDLTAEYGNVIYNATFLSVNGTPLAKGTEVTFSTGNADFKGKVGDNGVATATIDLNSGEYNIKSYNPSTGEFTTNKLKITKASPNLNVTVKDIEEGADAVFDITSNSQNGLVILNIDNKDYNANLEKGKTSITVSNLTNGKYPYSVKYVGDANYTEQSITGNLNVKSDDVIITAPDVTKYYKGDERLTVSLTDKSGAPLKGKVVFITINGVTYNRTTDDKGIASMALGLPSNNYTANIAFKGDDEYKAVNTTCNVVIKATVIGKDLTKIEKAKVPYRATFLDSTGKPLAKGTEIQFNINGVFYKRVIGDNGEGQLNINLVAGKYTITATNTQTGENAANTVIINPRIVNNTDVTKFFKNGTQYYVTVLDDNGNPAKANESVTFNINGVLYTRQTNENGTARMNINLPPGKYTITAEYKNCKASNEIKVLPVLSAEDISMKYRDGSTFKANLVDGSGSPYANQNITFNINGVLYNRLTNENGTAELRINLMAGEYIITSTYNGASIANKVTIRP